MTAERIGRCWRVLSHPYTRTGEAVGVGCTRPVENKPMTEGCDIHCEYGPSRARPFEGDLA